MQFFQKTNNFLKHPVPATSLAVYRMLFSLLVLISTIRFLALGWVSDQYIQTQFHFKYFGFEWIPHLDSPYIYIPFILLIFASIGVFLGLFYRISSVLLFLSFTYIELLDISYYLNHYYFVSLTSLVLIFVPANHCFSLDIKWRGLKPYSHIPQYQIFVFKILLALVYVYAGIAKINYDWLFNAMPLKIWLKAQYDMPVFGSLFRYDITAYIFSWMGMIYDLTIVFFLSYKRTRIPAYLSVLFFHGITGYLFQIGVFPLVMSTLTLIFFPTSLHNRMIHGINKILPLASINSNYTLGTDFSRFKKIVFFIFFIFQFVFPFRYLLYQGNMYWTEEGYRFGWRVMLVEKAGTATFYVSNPENGKEWIIDNSQFLNNHQEKQMSFQPDMILQYAHFLDHHFKENYHISDPIVRAEVYVTLNSRPSKLLFDPQLDLSLIKDSFKPKTWIYHYEN